ncbi:hypothetical protein [Hymenobacter sp. BT770]|nr:hypothetical protein [Hymenobacter sp. BT770]
MFSSTKAGHFAHIGMTALLGQVASHELVPPDPTNIENYGHLIIQALVAIVTIWATVRKALQRPESVVKVPAEVLPLVKAGTGEDGSHGNSAK